MMSDHTSGVGGIEIKQIHRGGGGLDIKKLNLNARE